MNEARAEPFTGTQVKNAPRGGARARPEAPDARDAYRLEPHVCRVCHTRLVSRPGEAGRVFECPNCGAHAEGHDASVLCCCGMKVRRPNRGGASGHVLVDAGIRCQRNMNPTPDFPSIYIAAEV